MDPQGKAVADSLHTLGFAGVKDCHVGRHIVLDIDASDAKSADADVRAMCEKLLANPIIEDFEIASVSASTRSEQRSPG
jgi:phosphoribosylformylglycinamidine synthase